MRIRRRAVLVSLIALGTSAAFIACVGDAPGLPDSGDASTQPDVVQSGDTGEPLDSGAEADAKDAEVVETFDGSHPECNGVFPQDAPAAATIECDGGDIIPVGGAIADGRYYLTDQKLKGCASPLAPYRDVIQITTEPDGGHLVDVAVDGPGAARLNLAWTTVDSTHFYQYDVCPTMGAVGQIPYTAAGEAITYYLPPFGNLTFKKF